MSLLGLSLTPYPDIIQWWEYTGLIGGSLWILAINLFIFNLIFKISAKNIVYLLTIITIPMFFSFYISRQKIISKKSNIGFLAVRTNLPAKQVKYKMSYDELIQYLTNVLKKRKNDEKADDNLVFLLPETALTHPKNIGNLKDKDFEYFLSQNLINNNLAIITGGLLKEYGDIGNKLEHSFRQQGMFLGEEYMIFNSMLFLSDSRTDFRVKEKLVPFNEYLPYYQYLGEKATQFFYNGVFHFSTYNNRKNFEFKEVRIAPLICYESFVGNFVREFSNTDVITIGLNEGWYNSKKGFRLAEGHAIARAIENRRDIIKSSNCGIASHINYKGKIIKKNKNEEDTFLTYPSICQKKTIYHKHGDYIGFIAIGILLLQLILIIMKNKNKTAPNNRNHVQLRQ